MHFVDITMFYAAEGGGVSTYLNAKARWLAQRHSVQHTILSTNVDTADGEPATVRLPGILLPGIHGYRMPLSVARSARIVQDLQPDLIEAGDAGPFAWSALRVRQRLGVPAVAYCHSNLPQLLHDRFGGLALRGARKYLAHLYGRFDTVLAPSRLMVQQLAGLGIGHAIHQPLGIDSSIFNPFQRIDTLRRQLRLAPCTRLLVYAGRFTAEKKLTLLIDAVRKLGRPYHLLLIGGGADMPRHAQISYVPFRRDQRMLARLLAGCDLLVHPGDCETFGLIVLEAMACGLPVVAAAGGGVAELIDEATGILVPPDSVESLCGGIEAIFQRDLARMSAAACRKACAQYDWNTIMPQLMKRYASLLASRARAELEAAQLCLPE
ncbi:MAG: glycosyltransferase [Pseudomonadota bacterium]